MNIQIDNSSDNPIYLQIKNQIKAQIILGELKVGEQLPSIRFLAKELRVSKIFLSFQRLQVLPMMSW